MTPECERRLRARQAEAGATAVQASLVGLALPFAIAGIFYARELLVLVGADEWALAHGYRYTQWMLGGNAVIMLLFVSNAIYRGAKISLAFFWVLQLPLAYFLAIHLDWQHSGVFWAVFVTATSVALLTLWLFTRGKWKAQQV